MTVSAGPPLSLRVLTAVTGPWESRLVSGLERERGSVEVVRRCADLADLLATAATGQAQAVVLSADLRRLDGDALSRLRASRVAVVALVEPGDEPARRRLGQLGVAQVLPADATATAVAAAVRTAVNDLEGRAATRRSGPEPRPAPASSPRVRSQRSAPPPEPIGDSGPLRAPLTASADPPATVEGETAGDDPASADSPASDAVSTGTAAPGTVVVVWGPTGAPGRTTTAVSVATELACLGESTLLVDADTYAASIGQALGLLDEAPGLASAARSADHGTLDIHQLSRLAPQVAPNLRVLTGIARAHRWPELRPAALGTVLTLARSLARFTVVDTGFCLEQDEELSYDTAAPRRNGATLAALEHADVLLAVGTADPIGLQRLVRGLQDLAEICPCRPVVVVTRVRSSAVGSAPGRRVREALERYAGVVGPVLVPDDVAALDAAMLAGRTLAEVAPGSSARTAYSALADRLLEEAAPTRSAAHSRSRRAVS